MPLELRKYSDLGELEYSQVDDNWSDIEDVLTTTGDEVNQQSSDSKSVTPASIHAALERKVIPYSASISLDGESFAEAEITLTGNLLLAGPTNFTRGTKYLWLKGSNATDREVTFDSNYFKGAIPALTDVRDSRWYLLVIVAYSTSHYVVTSTRAL